MLTLIKPAVLAMVVSNLSMYQQKNVFIYTRPVVPYNIHINSVMFGLIDDNPEGVAGEDYHV